MKLAAINALRELDYGALATVAEWLGIDIAELRRESPVIWDGGPWITKEMLRLAIIDAICDRELAAQR